MDEMTEDKREVCSKCQKIYEITQKKCKKCHGPLFLVVGEALIPYKIIRLKKVAKVLSVISIIGLVLYGFWYSSFNIQRQAIFYPSRKESNVWVHSFGDKYGLATPDQKMVTRPFMKDINTFSDKGLALYSLEEQRNSDILGAINSSGDIVIQPSFKDYLYDRTRHGESFTERGLIYQDVNGEKSSVINSEGKIILKEFGYIDYREIYSDRRFRKVFPYRIESKDELVGLVSITGEIVKEPFAAYIQEYEYLNVLEYSSVEGKKGLLDLEGDELFPAGDYTFEKPEAGMTHIIYQVGEEFGLIDLQGQIVKEPFASKITFHQEGYYRFYLPEVKGIGLMTDQGEIILEPFVNEISKFDRGGIAQYGMIDSHKVGLINQEGQVVKEPFAEKIGFFDADGMARFQLEENEQYGLINKQGAIVKEPFATEIYQFNQAGLAKFTLEEGQLQGVINQTGKEILPAEMSQLTYQFADKIIEFTKANGTKGQVNFDGSGYQESRN